MCIRDRDNKEATPVEDLEEILPPTEPSRPIQTEEPPERPTITGDSNIMEMLKNMMEENRKHMESSQKNNESLTKNIESMNKKMDDSQKNIELLKEELKEDGQKNIALLLSLIHIWI